MLSNFFKYVMYLRRLDFCWHVNEFHAIECECGVIRTAHMCDGIILKKLTDPVEKRVCG